MKKLLTGILTLALAAAMSVPAFAANSATNNGTAGTDITINGKFLAGSAAADVISVDIAWDEMSFTYTEGGKGTWNPESHAYDGATVGGWTATNGTNPKITVTNHSNVDVQASFAFNGAIEGLIGSFTKNVLVLDTAENTARDNAPTGETAFSVDGTAIDADKSLGTITVTVAKADEPATIVTTFAELKAAVNNGGTVKLGNDITLESILEINTDSPLILDLNGHTITGDDFGISLVFGICTIQGGSITVTNGMAVNNVGESLTIDRCTLSSSNATLYCGSSSSVTTVKNSILIRDPDSEYAIFGDAGDVFLEGTVNISGIIEGNVTVRPGTYNFDVSSYVDTTLYDVTDNGTTWTVTAK